MADKRHRFGACDGSKLKRYRSDPSSSSASDLNWTHPSTSARRPSTIGCTSPSDSLMDPDQCHPLPVPSHAPFSPDFSAPSSPPEVGAPPTDPSHRDHSPSYSKEGWCYTTASPEPMNDGDQDDGDDLAASTLVFPYESQRPTFIEEKQTEKETYTNNPDTVQPWEEDPGSYLMSQGAMEGEGHRCYDSYFDIPGPQGNQLPYPYALALDIEDPDSPEPTDRPENVDVAASGRVGWPDQIQEEGEWDDCAVEGPYPGPDGFENDQGKFTTQGPYQVGAASWLPSLYRH